MRALVEKTAADTAPPDQVAKAVLDALTAKRPKTRYLAGKGAKAIAAIAATLPDRLKDLAVAHEAHLPGAGEVSAVQPAFAAGAMPARGPRRRR